RVEEDADGLKDACKLASLSGKRLVINFQDVEWMPDAMIGTLVLLDKAAREQAVDLRLANISPSVLEVFKITQLDKVFNMGGEGPDALGSGAPRPKPPGTLPNNQN
ncbi:MAG: STAS domain-containing protein, partial [Pirellula sp.]